MKNVLAVLGAGSIVFTVVLGIAAYEWQTLRISQLRADQAQLIDDNNELFMRVQDLEAQVQVLSCKRD